MNILTTSKALVLGHTFRRFRSERNSRCELLVKQLTWTLLIFVIFDCLNAQAQDCQQGQYLNASWNGCESCTDCSSIGLTEVTPCTEDSDTVCRQMEMSDCTFREFYNGTSKQCHTCTECLQNEEETSKCASDHDAMCTKRCAENFIYQDHLVSCVLDCNRCQTMQCKDTHHCLCDTPRCYADTDIMCSKNLCEATSTEESTTNAPKSSSSDSTLAPWGIGLIAIGVVIGIVAFSACFLFMGLCTSSSPLRGHPIIGSEESQNSQSGLVTSVTRQSETSTTSLGSQSGAGHHTIHKQTSLEILRQSSKRHQLYRHQHHYHHHHQQRHNSCNGSVVEGSSRNLKTGTNTRKETTTPAV